MLWYGFSLPMPCHTAYLKPSHYILFLFVKKYIKFSIILLTVKYKPYQWQHACSASKRKEFFKDRHASTIMDRASNWLTR